MASIVLFLIIFLVLEAALCYVVKRDLDLKKDVFTVMFTMLALTPTLSLIATAVILVCIDLWYISLPATLFIVAALCYMYEKEIKSFMIDLKERRKERKGK